MVPAQSWETALVYSVTGMVMGSGGPTVVRLHTNSALAALAVLQSEQSFIVVVDEQGRHVPENELRRLASRPLRRRRRNFKPRILH